MTKQFRCPVCGYVHLGDSAPDFCPVCKAPGDSFIALSDEAKQYAAEHVVGIAAGVDAEVLEGLRMNFTGECTEVGMYLAMSRVAEREGYPEIAEAFKRYAFEEADHASRFAELLGEVLTTPPRPTWSCAPPPNMAHAKVKPSLPSAPKSSILTRSTTLSTRWHAMKRGMERASTACSGGILNERAEHLS